MGRLGAKKKDEHKKKESEVMSNLIGKDDVILFILGGNFKKYGANFDLKH
jgi:hypothetical protein